MAELGRLNRAGRRARERDEARTAKRAKKVALSGGAVLTLGGSLVVASASPAAADTFVVDTNSDDPGAEETNTTLREAIEAANANPGPDTIVFASSVSGTIQLVQGQLVVTDDLTISPPAYDIDVQAEAGYRVFYLYGNAAYDPIDVSIGGISISGGTPAGGDGGNVLARNASVVLDDVVVEDGSADGEGGGIAFIGGGDASLVITDSRISGNTATGDGGGVYADEPTGVVVTDSTIADNQSLYGDGGGLWVEDASVTGVVVTGSTITGNEAGASAGQYAPYGNPYYPGTIPFDDDGGGIWVNNSDLTVADSNLASNTASDDGGALYVDGAYYGTGTSVTISQSQFVANRAEDGNGGGISVTRAEDLSISDSVIAFNYAQYDGGGLRSFADNVTIAGSSISGNTAQSGDGGGVHVDDADSFSITDSYVLDNEADSGDNGGGLSVDVDGSSPVTISGTTVSGNSAGEGGGAYIEDGEISIVGSTFADNDSYSYGGGLFLYDTDDVTIDGITVSNNDAGDGGGGIMFDNVASAVTISDSAITGNSAGGAGGGIYFYDSSGDIVIDNTTVTGNSADAGGGIRVDDLYGLYGDTASLSILNSDISNNSAKYVGGGIYADEILGDVTISNTTVSGNTADLAGGAIVIRQVASLYASTSEVAILGSTIANNSAKYAVGGAGIIGVDGNVVVSGTTITGNEVEGGFYSYPYFPYLYDVGGLGIADVYGDVLVENTTISENAAVEDGGGMWVRRVGGTTTVTGSTITGNDSFNGHGGGAFFDNVAELNIADTVFDANTAYDGGGFALFDTDADVTVTDVVVTGNSSSGDGGGIYLYEVEDAVTLTGLLVSGNSAGGDGGGIALDNVADAVTIVESTISGNSSGSDGGGLAAGDFRLDGSYYDGGELVIDSSTVSSNLAGDDGGGIWLYDTDDVDIVNSTVSGNSAADDGGGLALAGQDAPSIRHSTIVENAAGSTGGGLYVSYDSTASLDHTIVGDNGASAAPDAGGDGVLNARFSLFETDPAASGLTFFDLEGNIIGVDPELGPLADNGGPTQTHLPLPGSPVIDAGDPNFAPPPATDQRDLPREVGVIDIGSVEVQAATGGGGGVGPALVQFEVAAVTVDEDGGALTLTVTRTGDSSGTATVRVTSADGTATASQDYGAIDTTVTFAPGETTRTVTIPIADDFLDEADETFTVSLSEPTGAALGAIPTVTVTIVDDADVCDPGASHPFTDIPAGNVHAANIGCAFDLGLTVGTSPTTYGPGEPVSRAQMASFIAHVLEAVGFDLPDSPPDAFDDDNGTVHELAINQLAALGIIQGTGPRAYNPSGNVSRGQMARFLVGAYETATGTDATPTSDHFSDDNGTTFENDINTGFELGLFVGTSPTTYTPNVDVRRDQMATFLVRLVDALAEAGLPPVA